MAEWALSQSGSRCLSLEASPRPQAWASPLLAPCLPGAPAGSKTKWGRQCSLLSGDHRHGVPLGVLPRLQVRSILRQ